jgi:hypothetical protein
MNAYAAFTADQAIEQMLDDVRQARLARAASAHPVRRSLISRAVEWTKSKLDEPVSDTFMIVPKLTGYPYRS